LKTAPLMLANSRRGSQASKIAVERDKPGLVEDNDRFDSPQRTELERLGYMACILLRAGGVCRHGVPPLL
jgi:hypothetical protein